MTVINLPETTQKDVDAAFKQFIGDPTISVILVTQDISEKFLREAIANHNEVYPVILEIPAK